MDEIIPGVLFLSDYFAASDIEELDRNNIMTVVNISDQPRNNQVRSLYEENGIQHVFFPCEDEPEENIDRYFSAFLDLMEKAPKPVLVHCWAGISRSATLAIIFVIVYMEMSVTDAFLHVRKQRPVIGPNGGFMKQIRAWESKRGQFSQLNSTVFFLQTLNQWYEAEAGHSSNTRTKPQLSYMRL